MSRWRPPRRAPVALVCAALGSACTGERWVVGEELVTGQADAGLLADAAVSCEPSASEGIPAGVAAAPIEAAHLGRWTAQLAGAEASKFPDEQLVLELTPERGLLRFGAPAPLPAAQAGAGFLCGTTRDGCATASGFIAGFDYQLGRVSSRGSVISMGVFIGQSTKIYDRATGEIHQGRVPSGSVVVPGSLPAKDGSHSLYCAVIVKRVDEATRSRTSINEILRDAG